MNELRSLVPAILWRAALDARHTDERAAAAREWLRGRYASELIEATDAVDTATVREWLGELESVR